MLIRPIAMAVSILFIGLGATQALGESREDNWPTWRGPNSDGVAVKGNPPITWSETENIKWKVPIRGGSDSTPIVWGNKIFFQTAIPLGEVHIEKSRPTRRGEAPQELKGPGVAYDFNVVCLDRRTGETLWEKTARQEIPHQGHHAHSSLASFSPVTDGKLLWVNFGSRGLHCYDLDGNHKWSADLIQMQTINSFGEGSSPALVGDSVIVVADHEGDSKIFSFNKDTGQPLWVKDRDEPTGWATPMPVKVNGAYQVIVPASGFIRAYDVETGDELWRCSGLTQAAIPSPVLGFGKVYCATGFGGFAMLAIELGRTGDLTGTDGIAWQIDDGTPYVPSPILYGDKIYVTQGVRSVLSCYEADTGKPIYLKQKLEGMKSVYASPTAVAGRIYFSDRYGTTSVVKHSDTFEILATNKLDDKFDASPVIIGDELYLKGDKYLYCIAKS